MCYYALYIGLCILKDKDFVNNYLTNFSVKSIHGTVTRGRELGRDMAL